MKTVTFVFMLCIAIAIGFCIYISVLYSFEHEKVLILQQENKAPIADKVYRLAKESVEIDYDITIVLSILHKAIRDSATGVLADYIVEFEEKRK